MEANRGRKWQQALDVWNEFIISQRRAVISALEDGRVENLNEKLAELRTLKRFEDYGHMYIEQGLLAERRLSDG